MKTFQFFIIAVLFAARLFSQDTLFTKNGEMIGAKVVEINQDEIKYKKSSNPDGPMYVVKKSQIVLIEYQNGSRDVFQGNANASPNSSFDNSGNNNSQSDPVYANRGSNINVLVGALPFLSLGPWGWGWGWNSGWRNGWYNGGWGRNWGWGRGYYRGGGFQHHGGHNYGHYGRRGGWGHR